MENVTADDIRYFPTLAKRLNLRPGMYFNGREPSPQAIGEFLSEAASMLGANVTKFNHAGNWWLFCADVDWIIKPSNERKSVEAIFKEGKAFLDTGFEVPGNSLKSPMNSIGQTVNREFIVRPEVLCGYFSSDVFTYAAGELVVIKGSNPRIHSLDEFPSKFSDWGRVIGFRFSPVANDDWACSLPT